MSVAKIRPTVGDVFSVELESGQTGFFQYIADDSTQLNSNVIRVFLDKQSRTQLPKVESIVLGEVHFVAHVFLRVGLKFGAWERIGNSHITGGLDTLFRDSDDYGNPQIDFSDRWYIWNIGERQRFVGKLSFEYQHAEIGVVVSPEQINLRMSAGSYSFKYPSY